MPETKPDIIFVLSVDTEEEWDWNTQFPQHSLNVSNAEALPKFQQFCSQLGIKPTYFVDYAMVDNQQSSAKLKEIYNNGNCEIGAHLHPWCNPPLIDKNTDFESHVVNLPIDLVEQKLTVLLDKIKQSLDLSVNAFRTGRWGINAPVLKLLAEKGISVDSSILPYYKNDYFSCYSEEILPYWPSLDDPLKVGVQNQIAEIPVSAGFNNRHFDASDKVFNIINHPSLKFLRLTGIAWQTRLIRKIYMSPELSSAEELKALCSSLIKRKAPIIHMNLHSSSLIDLPYENNRYSGQTLYSNIQSCVNELTENATVTFCTISEAKEQLL